MNVVVVQDPLLDCDTGCLAHSMTVHLDCGETVKRLVSDARDFEFLQKAKATPSGKAKQLKRV